MNATLNGTFIRPPAPEPDQVKARWLRLTRYERAAFVRSVGERSAVRDFGLSVVDVALALPLRADLALERVARLAKG